jgi:putative ABC transport system permease protein
VRAVLGLLVRLFPAAFRERFGGGMVEQVEQDYEHARARGFPAAAWFSLATGWDLVRSAIAERVRPTWVSAQPSNEETEMRWTANEWMTDLRHAMRSLKRSPGFTAVATGTLGLAIGVTAGMFSVVDTVLLHPLPYANVDRLVSIAASAPGSGMPEQFGVAAEFYLQYKEQSKLLEDVSAYGWGTSTLRTDDRVERVAMAWPTNSLFATLGAKPILGRLPVDADEDHVVVISYRLWQSWFAGDRNVLGRAYMVSGAKRTVVGVMGPAFKFPGDDVMLWVSGEIHAKDITSPGQFGMNLVGRVKPGVSPKELANELTALSKALPRRFGGSVNYAKTIEQHRAIVITLEQQMLGGVARPLWVLLGAVTIVLLIACANVANLFLVRAEGRQRDLAVRRAIGAARGRLIWSQMSEAVVVAGLAGVVAVLLAAVSLPIFLRAAPPDIPRLGEVSLNVMTALFTLGVALVSALACGLIPAIHASAPDLTRLRDGSRGSTRRRSWGRDGLVVGQTALALVLLIGSGLLVRSFWALRHVNPGYHTENIFTFQIAPEGPHLTDGPSFAQFDMDFMERLRALPGVETVGLVENIPLNEGTRGTRFRTEDMSNDPNAGVHLAYTFTAGDYFKAMGIDVRGGRPFDNNDHISNLRNVVISKTAANLLWPGKDPIGQRVQRQGLKSWETVVGVVDDVMQYGFRDKPEAVVYFPLVGPEPTSWVISSPAFVIKTRRAETIAPEVRALVHTVAPNAPMYRVYTMAQLAKDSMVQLSFTMLTLGIASALALVLGAVGLYGVLSYVVAQRTREIGVRMALGAEAAAVRRMVVAQGARVVAVGVLIGVGVALASTRALASLLFGVKALDAPTFVGMSASMVVIGLLASYVPARRASKVDPIESLRGD